MNIVLDKPSLVLDPAYKNFLARCATKPNGIFHTALNNLFINLRADGNLALLDYLRVYCQDVKANAGLNILSNNFNVTEVNNPAWTYGRGYTGNGTSAYLNTNYNPRTNGVNYTKNSACFGVYLLSSVSDSSNEMGCYDGTNFLAVLTKNVADSKTYLLINDGTSESFTPSTITTQGMISIVRTGASATESWFNGVRLYTGTAASTNTPNINLYEMCRNQNGTPSFLTTNTIAFSFVGSGSINQQTLYNSLQVFARQVGCAV